MCQRQSNQNHLIKNSFHHCNHYEHNHDDAGFNNAQMSITNFNILVGTMYV